MSAQVDELLTGDGTSARGAIAAWLIRPTSMTDVALIDGANDDAGWLMIPTSALTAPRCSDGANAAAVWLIRATEIASSWS